MSSGNISISTHLYYFRFYNIIVFLFIFNNSTCHMTLHGYAWLYHIGASCTNCGVSRPTDGLCARCLDLPYCKICKRHLENNCFNEVQHKICQVHLQIILFLHVTVMRILHTLQIALLFLSLHVVSSVCHRTVKNDALYGALALHSITS